MHNSPQLGIILSNLPEIDARRNIDALSPSCNSTEVEVESGPPVPLRGRTKGLNVHAVTLLRVTRADQRAQHAVDLA